MVVIFQPFSCKESNEAPSVLGKKTSLTFVAINQIGSMKIPLLIFLDPLVEY
jgi:hypothetical protein